jgi:hypothetical protein
MIFFIMFMYGCTHQMTLMSWTGSEIGSGTAKRSRVRSGDLTIQLGDDTYTGKWIHAHGSSDSLLDTYGAKPTVGTASVVSGRGVSSSILTSTSGKSLKCEFSHSIWSITGPGVCKTDDGKVYDIQIN